MITVSIFDKMITSMTSTMSMVCLFGTTTFVTGVRKIIVRSKIEVIILLTMRGAKDLVV